VKDIILELQKEATDSKVPASTLLRKALILANKLDCKEDLKWIESELNGYESIDEIPTYRRLKGIVEAKNPYKGWIPVDFMGHHCCPKRS